MQSAAHARLFSKQRKMRGCPRELTVFVYIAPMATIPQITFESKIHGTARVISLAIITKTTITKTITIR
jgi:hypothetical protein